VKKSTFITILLIIFVFLISSCSSKDDEIPTSLDIPTPSADKAVIHGVLLDASNDKPVSGRPFLARILETENSELPLTVSFSLQNDPGAKYDTESGFFYFDNVEPREGYVIILVYGPGNYIVLKNPMNDSPYKLDVTAGETLDLGVIRTQESDNE
jgi:hypothetical protein